MCLLCKGLVVHSVESVSTVQLFAEDININPAVWLVVFAWSFKVFKGDSSNGEECQKILCPPTEKQLE